MKLNQPSLVLLRLLFLGLSLSMIGITIDTSLSSNLLKEWNALGDIPWMRATLWDFYFNIVILMGWMIYKERHLLWAPLWALAFIGLGSIATCFYVFLQLMHLKPGEDILKVFQPSPRM
jgi:hypothetical protein